MPKKVPIRTCIGCRATKPKKELARIIADENQGIIIDPTEKAHGRGAYLCKKEDAGEDKILIKEECLVEAVKKRAFNRAFAKEVKVDKGSLIGKED